PGLASSSICSSFAHRTNLYGPLPTGFRSAKTLSFPRKWPGGMMAPRSARWFSSVGYGLEVSTRTVCLSTTSTEVTSLKYTLCRAFSYGSCVQSRLNFTASASTASPLWHLTPLRILNSHVVGFTSPHDSASHGNNVSHFARHSRV